MTRIPAGQVIAPRREPRLRRRRPAAYAFVCLALLLVTSGSAVAEDGRVRELLVDRAATPAEHLASADYYAQKARESREEVVRHREMGVRYSEGDMKNRLEQRAHCERIASLHLQLAREYEALAHNHHQEADRQLKEMGGESQ